MSNDAPDFDNRYQGGTASDSPQSPDYDNPWPNANGGSDAPAAKESDGTADARDAGKSTADKSKLPLISLAVVLAIAVIAGGFWALSGKSSDDSDGEDVGSLQAENARLNSDNDRIRELESDLEEAQTGNQSVIDQRDALIKAFGGLDPCSATNFGTPEGAFWGGSPEMGLGCSYIKEGKVNLVVTVAATDTPIPFGEFTQNNGVEGYMLSSSHGKMAVYVWLAGSGSETEQKAHEIMEWLTTARPGA